MFWWTCPMQGQHTVPSLHTALPRSWSTPVLQWQHRKKSGHTALSLHPREEKGESSSHKRAWLTWPGLQQEQRAQWAPSTPSALQRGSDCISPPSLAMLFPPCGYSPNAMAELHVQITSGKAITAFLQSICLLCQVSALTAKKKANFVDRNAKVFSFPTAILSPSTAPAHDSGILHQLYFSWALLAIAASSAKIWGKLEWVTTSIRLINT